MPRTPQMLGVSGASDHLRFEFAAHDAGLVCAVAIRNVQCAATPEWLSCRQMTISTSTNALRLHVMRSAYLFPPFKSPGCGSASNDFASRGIVNAVISTLKKECSAQIC